MSRRSLQPQSSITSSMTSENALSYSLEHLKGLETAAGVVLKKAVEMDNARRYLEALCCYREGLGLLMDIVRNTNDDDRKQKFRVRMEEYMNRAEKLKILVEREKRAGRFHQQRKILENEIGNSYESIFKSLLDDEVTHVEVEDPYIRAHHQICNFVRFCELVCRYAPKLKTIILTTSQAESKDVKQQEESLDALMKSCASRSITLTVRYSSTLHDREIRFNNGFVVKIGRGLDYFKFVPKCTLGFYDMDLRPCQETTIDIFFRTSGDQREQSQNAQSSATSTPNPKSPKPRVRFMD